jgi:hypothetical protein
LQDTITEYDTFPLHIYSCDNDIYSLELCLSFFEIKKEKQKKQKNYIFFVFQKKEKQKN